MPPLSPSHRGGPSDQLGCTRRTPKVGQPALSLLFFPPQPGGSSLRGTSGLRKPPTCWAAAWRSSPPPSSSTSPRARCSAPPPSDRAPRSRAWATAQVGRREARVAPGGDARLGTLRAQPSPPPGPKLTALECLEGMAAGLYSELFTLLISLLNRYTAGFGVGGAGGGRSAPTHPPTHPVGVPSRPPQGAQVQPALGVLGDGGGHPRGAEPRGGGAEPRGHLRGAVPQLRPGAPAAPLPPAHLRPGAGALQGGSGDAPGGAVTPLLSPFCSSISCDIPPHPVLPKFLNKWSLRTGSNPISSDTALSALGVSGGVPTADGAGKRALGGLLRVVGGRRWPLLHLGTTWVPTGTLFGVLTAPGTSPWSSGAVGRPGNPRLLSRSD